MTHVQKCLSRPVILPLEYAKRNQQFCSSDTSKDAPGRIPPTNGTCVPWREVGNGKRFSDFMPLLRHHVASIKFIDGDNKRCHKGGCRFYCIYPLANQSVRALPLFNTTIDPPTSWLQPDRCVNIQRRRTLIYAVTDGFDSQSVHAKLGIKIRPMAHSE